MATKSHDAFSSAAVQAFKEAERVRLLLDKKERALSKAVKMMALKSHYDTRLAYFEDTEAILEEYEAKRADLP